MYKGASALNQSRHDRQVVVDAMVAGGRNEIQTAREELASVQVALKNAERRIVTLSKKSAERAALGQRIHELHGRARELKGKLFGQRKRPGDSLGPYFINAARDRLPKVTFDLILKEAHAAWDAERAARDMSAVSTDRDVAA